MKLVPITFNKVMQSKAYTVIILGSSEKQFAIYTDPAVGKHLQVLLTEQTSERPLTHDLVHSLLQGFGIVIKQVVINHLEDTTYFCRIFLEQDKGEEGKTLLEIDARPSDGLTLALMQGAPIYCRQDVLDLAVAVEEN